MKNVVGISMIVLGILTVGGSGLLALGEIYVHGLMALTVVCIAGWIVWRTQGASKETSDG